MNLHEHNKQSVEESWEVHVAGQPKTYPEHRSEDKEVAHPGVHINHDNPMVKREAEHTK